MKQVCLLTGRPGTGKTSLIKEAAARMAGRAGGFYTEEIRNRGVREGFRLITLDGKEVVLSRTGMRGPYRVGKYGVDIEALNAVGVPAVIRAIERADLVVIDEIGRIELFSEAFREAVDRAIGSGRKVLGTIMLNSHPWADEIKKRPGVELLSLTRDSYSRVLADVLDWMGGAKAQSIV